MDQIYELTIKLIRYVLKRDITEVPEDTDFEKLYDFGESHGIENMLYVGLRDLNIRVPNEIMNKFKTAYEKQIMVEATQELEFEALCESFEEAGIDFLPLKGAILKNYYPMPDYRKSGDTDILIKIEDEEKVDFIMRSIGYEMIKRDKVELHNEYRKPPYVLTEIHLRLVEEYNRAYQYFSNIWNIAKLSDGNKHLYEMDNECFYAFIVAHLCKHIRNGGAGIKFIIDIWILRNKLKMNDQKLKEILTEANILQFEQTARELAYNWIDDKDITKEDTYILKKFILESGSYGSIKNAKSIQSSIATDSLWANLKYKIVKLYKGFFLSYYGMKQQYPFIEKYKILYPLTWFMRLFRLIFAEKRTISDMYNSAAYTDSNSKGLRNLWETVR